MKAVVRDRHCSERLYRSVCFTSETELLYPVISWEPESQVLKPELAQEAGFLLSRLCLQTFSGYGRNWSPKELEVTLLWTLKKNENPILVRALKSPSGPVLLSSGARGLWDQIPCLTWHSTASVIWPLLCLLCGVILYVSLSAVSPPLCHFLLVYCVSAPTDDFMGKRVSFNFFCRLSTQFSLLPRHLVWILNK